MFAGIGEILSAMEPDMAKAVQALAKATSGNLEDYEEILGADEVPWDTEPEKSDQNNTPATAPEPEPLKKKAAPKKKQEQTALTADDLIRVVTQKIKQNRANKEKVLALLKSYGAADMLIIGKDENGKGLIHVCDFKTGAGVFVDADHNSQMMLYALGGLAAYGFLYDVETVRMTIIQPRLDNISTFECSRQELEDWGESIRLTALLAFEGKGEQRPGDWCRFCRAKPVCKACADEALALCREDFLDLDAGAFGDTAEESDMTAPYEADTQTAVFKQTGLIPIAELAEILPTLNRISSWIDAVFAFVSSEAINHGVPIPGYKVVEGRSKRVFTDTKAVVDTAVANGYTDLYKQTLITLTEFEKMMGKKKFNELLGEYVAKPPGKLALVPESDPREPVDLTATPDQEFTALPDEK